MSHFLLDVKYKQRSHNTLTSYIYCLALLAQLLETMFGVTDLEAVTVVHLRQCAQHLLTAPLLTGKHHRKPHNGSSLSIATVRSHIRVWKSFFNWCFQEELIDKNPVIRLASPQPPKRIIPAFTNEHIEKMLASFDTSTDEGFRDWLILLLLLDTGMRLSEIAGLRVENVHDTCIKVFGKGRKEREIGIHPEIGKLLWKYIHKYRHPRNDDEPLLFISCGRGKGLPLGEGGIKHMMDRVKAATGIEGVRLSAHTFRHTFAKMYLDEGGELFKLSRELGHSDVQTTRIYLEDFNSTNARKEHGHFSPINRFNLKKQQKKRKKQE